MNDGKTVNDVNDIHIVHRSHRSPFTSFTARSRIKGSMQAQKIANEINYCQNGLLAKAKFTLVFWTQALSHSLHCFYKKGH